MSELTTQEKINLLSTCGYHVESHERLYTVTYDANAKSSIRSVTGEAPVLDEAIEHLKLVQPATRLIRERFAAAAHSNPEEFMNFLLENPEAFVSAWKLFDMLRIEGIGE